jgi:hypothetical protein
MRFMYFLFGLFFVVIVSAHEAHTEISASEIAVSLAVDHQGNLWRASVLDGFIFVDMSADQGKTFSKKVKVNNQVQKIAAKGEARPKIGLGPQGNLYLTWTEGLSKPFAGYVWFARSLDGGKHFEQSKIVHQDRAEITHRFDALHISPDGKITVIWVDKRDLESAKKVGKPYTGAAIYYAVSADDGATFQVEKKLADNSCECCRIATATKPDGTVVALWRHVFKGDERDHMIAEIPKKDEVANLHRATFGHWKLDGCPHHGGALASGGDDDNWWGYHLAYFDGKDKNPGLYYSRIDGEAWIASTAKQFGDTSKQASHPALLSVGKKVWLSWLETHASNTKKVMMMVSSDDGKTWSDASPLYVTRAYLDYPQLLRLKGATYLVINTSEGLKLKEVP